MWFLSHNLAFFQVRHAFLPQKLWHFQGLPLLPKNSFSGFMTTFTYENIQHFSLRIWYIWRLKVHFYLKNCVIFRDYSSPKKFLFKDYGHITVENIQHSSECICVQVCFLKTWHFYRLDVHCFCDFGSQFWPVLLSHNLAFFQVRRAFLPLRNHGIFRDYRFY